MPYVRDGKCVYKENPDKTRGEKVGCSDTVEMAKKYMKKLYMEEGKSLVNHSMVITKASRDKETGAMRLRLVNSDTGEDKFGERMSLELFNDFVERSDNNLPVPEPFDAVINETKWKGGKPYLSIAHYKSDTFDEFPGEQEKLYVDGEKLKSVDVLHNNSLGNSVWKAVYNDLYGEEKDYENPVRVSIGFLDLAHKHELEDGEIYFERKSLTDRCEACEQGLGGKVYLKGHLVHKAFTRVPAHPRTDVEIEMKSDAIQTKKQDAQSILGEEFDIEEKSLTTDELIVTKAKEEFAERSDETEGEPQLPEADKSEATDNKSKTEKSSAGDTPVSEVEMDEKEEVQEVEEVVEEVVETAPEVPEEVVEEPTPEKSAVLTAAEQIDAKLKELAEKGIYGEEALSEVQPMFNALGETVKSIASPKGEMGNLDAVVKSAVAEVVPDIVSQVVKELSAYVKPAEAVQPQSEIPAPRSLNIAKSAIPEQGQQALSQIQRIANQTVGLK